MLYFRSIHVNCFCTPCKITTSNNMYYIVKNYFDQMLMILFSFGRKNESDRKNFETKAKKTRKASALRVMMKCRIYNLCFNFSFV